MSNTENTGTTQTFDVRIEKQMKESYIDYAMSVIVGRALPDVRDGLKPVHRRILYTMGDLGLTPEKAHRKCAKIVGDVMGRFHPHGDTAIYDTLVRLAQDFNMRYPLVDGHGNFGSIDGDNAAAMRYTEARMAKPAIDLLADIKMDTVDFADNYDSTEKEPTVLPNKLPNLLLNGSSGIAVGMATSIPPHNMNEVIDATVKFIDNPETTEVADLMADIKGPDFPTGGEILGKQGLRDAYETGRGKVTVRGRVVVETQKNGRERLIVTEMPYMVNKSNMIESMADLVRNKKIEGITDIRDESSREGIRVVIELKRDANPYVVQNLLYKHTQLQNTFSIIMLALDNNKPVVHTLKEMLWKFIEHRRVVVRRRTEFELKKAKARAHILEGLHIALENIDEVIAIIKKSNDGPTARAALIARFELSEIQAQAILDMRLQKLTGLEQQSLLDELEKLLEQIAEFEDILANPHRIDTIIKEELVEMKAKYGDERRTEIAAGSADFDIEDLIQREEVVITVTRAGYIKRLPVDTYRSQGRGGRGIIGSTQKADDIIRHLFVTSSHDYILFFSNRGQVYRMKGYQIPQASRTAKGIPIVNLLQLNEGEWITATIPITEFAEDHYLLMVTKFGIVKKTVLRAFDTSRKGGIRALTLRQDDQLRYVLMTDGAQDIILATKTGLSIRFHESDVRFMGRAAAGVRGIRLGPDNEVVGAGIVNDDASLLVVCEKGYGKRTLLSQYRTQKRGGKGILTIKASERNGNVIGIAVADIDEELMMISAKGIVIRQKVADISETVGRSTMGVRLMRLGKGDSVVTFEVFKKEEVEENGYGENGENSENNNNDNNNEGENGNAENSVEKNEGNEEADTSGESSEENAANTTTEAENTAGAETTVEPDAAPDTETT